MIELSTNHPALRFSYKETLRTIRHVYTQEGKSVPNLSVVFTYNRFIKRINKQFLRHDYFTDVISFSLGKGDGIEAELYINLDAARIQAKEYGVSFSQETKRLIIHGVLHVLGYDDKTEKEQVIIHAKEDTYIAQLQKK